MGFIAHNNTITMTAYTTPKGREYLVSGNPEDFRPAFFALDDSDTNYLQASETTVDGPNILPAGFVPDLSGDYTGSIKSLAAGVAQRSFLYGGATVGQVGTSGVLGTRIAQVGFGAHRIATTRAVTAAMPNTTYAVNIPLRTLDGVVNGGERVRVYLLPPHQGTSSLLYPHIRLENGGITEWAPGNPSARGVRANFSLPIFPPVTPVITHDGGYRCFLYFAMVPYKSAVLVPQSTAIFAVEILLSTTITSGATGLL